MYWLLYRQALFRVQHVPDCPLGAENWQIAGTVQEVLHVHVVLMGVKYEQDLDNERKYGPGPRWELQFKTLEDRFGPRWEL